jgi:hypothetical protein
LRPPQVAVSSSALLPFLPEDLCWYRLYQSRIANAPYTTVWLQIDLGFWRRIDEVKFLPFGSGFPIRFTIECSNDPALRSSQLIVERTSTGLP